MLRRPNLSAREPANADPTAIPMELTLPIKPVTVVERCHSLASDTSTYDKSPTSNESNSKPNPDEVSIRAAETCLGCTIGVLAIVRTLLSKNF
ncbi:hypothetical protein N007_15475 [Alicyclobacillus acidoterrestris ATCC 49025]|nr:hypothetical protein N007_15475 [Alicyclobacillus acidoterrestris ATCC 49025]